MDRRSAACLDGVAVSSGEADGVASCGLEEGSDVLVAPSGVYHGHDLQRLFVGDSAAFDHLRNHAHLLLHLACHDSAAMNENLHSRHCCKILDKLPQQFRVVHHIAAYLDYLYH